MIKITKVNNRNYNGDNDNNNDEMNISTKTFV